MKFESARLHKFKYDINLDLVEAIRNEELIALFENQLIDSILSINKREIDHDKINDIHMALNQIKKESKSAENGARIKLLHQQLNEEIFIPEYITIKMDTKGHYKYLYKHGLMLNGIKYKRFNSSAGQARVNTVLFIAETVFDELRKRTDNGRNLNKKIAPAKLNAYRGLYGSARYKVSTPRFCVVKDYESDVAMRVNFVTETDDWNEDDELEENKDIIRSFNRFDGQGLISPSFAKQWSEELGLTYTPSQFCIRAPFNKGMLCVFDIHEWVKQKNNSDYLIKSIYDDENGNPVMVDLREIDVILSESQMKLWDSWESVEHYRQCCIENEMSWGVTLVTPEFDKTFFYQNYQFLQTLNLNDEDVIKITNKFVKWVKGVTSENVYYTLLFLMGFKTDEKRFMHYINKGECDWIRALILEPQLIRDKYIRTKVYNLIKKKIQDASLGKIITDGNFQVIVSDPYAMMEHVCGQEVVGLLNDKEYYSNYWNELNVKQVIASRSPLTYRSEHVPLYLKKNDETEIWYKYCKSGIILNAHNDATARFAGSDFDFDILATTSDETVIKGVFRNELPVVYNEPKAVKTIPTEDDLYKADVFSFDSIIGGLTNKSTTGYALLASLPIDSDEYNLTLKRIKTITKAQSAQIDKTKIGKEVKGIVGKWVKYQSPPRDEDDNIIEETPEEMRQRKLINDTLLNKHPYFFTHLYTNTKQKYKKHMKKYEILALQEHGITLDEIKNLKRRSIEQQEFLDEFYRKSPVLESDCVMNKICWRIESIDFEIKSLLKDDNDLDLHKLFLNEHVVFDDSTYKAIVNKYKEYNRSVRELMVNSETQDKSRYDEAKLTSINVNRERFKTELLEICSDNKELMNYIIHMFYVDNPKLNKDVMWTLFGNEIVENLKKKKSTVLIPIQSDDGELEYLNKRYTIKEMELVE